MLVQFAKAWNRFETEDDHKVISLGGVNVQ